MVEEKWRNIDPYRHDSGYVLFKCDCRLFRYFNANCSLRNKTG